MTGFISLPSIQDIERLERRIEILERIVIDLVTVEDWHGKARGIE